MLEIVLIHFHVLRINDFIQILFLHFLLFAHQLHKLHHPVIHQHLLFTHKTFQPLNLLTQELSNHLLGSDCFWNYLHFYLWGVLFIVLLYDRFVFFDWVILGLTQVLIYLFELELIRWLLFTIFIIHTAKVHKRGHPPDHVISQTFNQIQILRFKFSKFFHDLINQPKSVNLNNKHVIVALDNCLWDWNRGRCGKLVAILLVLFI